MSGNDREHMYQPVSTVKEFGERIRAKRKQLGLTQEHVAGLSGIGARYLSELERGKETVEMGKALRVANSLGLQLTVQPRPRLGNRSIDA